MHQRFRPSFMARSPRVVFAVFLAAGASACARGVENPLDSSGDARADRVDAAPRDAPPDVPCPGSGTALSFDLTKSENVVIPAALLPTGNAPRTIEMWVLNKSPIANWALDHSLWGHGGGAAL